MDTRVVNIKLESFTVLIGRPSVFGNPFRIGVDGTRGEVIAQFRLHFLHKIATDPVFKSRVLALRGQVLG